MSARKILLLALGIGFAALVVVPLRALKERAYSSKEVTLPAGGITASVDGDYHSLAVPFWFDGLQTDAPYRLRFFFRPKGSVTPQIVITRAMITSAGVPHSLPMRTAAGSWSRDRSGGPVFIVGFLDVPLSAPEAVAEIEFSLDGVPASARLNLVQTTSTKIVHSGAEAIMGL